MSSDLVPVLTFNQDNDYVSMMLISIVIYDYALTFAREIDYIWSRQWTWVSTLFVIARYVGLLRVLADAIVTLQSIVTYYLGPLWCKSPVPPLTLDDIWVLFEGMALSTIYLWGYILFLAAADLLMVLRVYAMWNQSKRILGILLFLYLAQIIVTGVWDGLYEAPDKSLSVVIEHTVVSTYCVFHMTGQPSYIYRAIPRFVLSATLLILAVISTIRQAAETSQLTGRWKVNQYMNLFMKEGVLYFVLTLLFNIMSALQLPPFWFTDALSRLSEALVYITMPHFIIGTRALYDRDRRRRWQGMDTGFGMISQSVSQDDEPALPTIVFADARPEDSVVESSTSDSEAISIGNGAG